MQVATFKAAHHRRRRHHRHRRWPSPRPAGTVSGTVTITANATDNVGVAGVQFLVDNNPLGAEDTTSPYSVTWNTTTVANGTHTLTALARDTSGNTALSAPVTVTVANAAGRLLRERGSGNRLRSADRHEVPARRAHAGG